jgi:IS30 family transposase
MPVAGRKTMTWDQDKEMARHEDHAANQSGNPFHAPHNLRQRGNNNISGLIRLYLPKGTDLSGQVQEQRDILTYALNIRLRQRLDPPCPVERMTQKRAKHDECPLSSIT